MNARLQPPEAARPSAAGNRDLEVLAAVAPGLPVVARPYAAVGARLGLTEREVIGALARLLDAGVVKRLGLVVHHRALGYAANAMVVWDLPDAGIDAVAARLVGTGEVSLCYRRPRRPPAWPYNLYCMLHGRDRGEVLGRLAALVAACNLADVPHEVLFSGRCHVQRGADYARRPGRAR